MKYPFVYKGITKIFISEIIQLAASILTGVGLFLLLNLGTNPSDDGALTGSIFSLTAVTFLYIIALIIYLIGLVQARREEHEFHLALIMTIIALALQIVSMPFSSVNPVVGEWIEFACEVIELLAFESVVSGVVKIGKELGDEKVISLGKKMRVLVTVIWIAMIAAKVLEFISGSMSENIKLVHDIMETVDHIFYMILLYKGRKMLLHQS